MSILLRVEGGASPSHTFPLVWPYGHAVCIFKFGWPPLVSPPTFYLLSPSLVDQCLQLSQLSVSALCCIGGMRLHKEVHLRHLCGFHVRKGKLTPNSEASLVGQRFENLSVGNLRVRSGTGLSTDSSSLWSACSSSSV